MSRYAAMFERLNGQGAFGAFLMLGDPDPATSLTLLDGLVAGGADMIEVGIPFSDPVADGPVIQAAAQRALRAGVKVGECFDILREFRTRYPDIPTGILTYVNLVTAPGRTSFFERAAASGADSLLIADLPVFEAAPWVADMRAAGIAPVLIAASNTPPANLRAIAEFGGAYTYCVTRTGITGTHAKAEFDRELVARLHALDAPPPVFGFGISAPEHVMAATESGAAGVICGSAIVDCAATGGDVAALVRHLKGNDSAAR